MIGVLCKASQLEVVEEFFQLFKTPWEFYRPDSNYAVVVATTAEVRNVNAKLLVASGPERKDIDAELGIVPERAVASATLTCGDRSLPIYGGICGFGEEAGGTVVANIGAEIVGVKMSRPDATVIRLGFDLFEEVERLLTDGQPIEHAPTPTLDCHIDNLRSWILEAGIPLIEIPPVPAGYDFAVCLTHDIDFIGIRQHKFDHTMWGFLYRSSVGAARNWLKRRISSRQLLKTWRAAATLPFVYLGLAEDFWEPFEWYLKAEQGLGATYFLIPFKRRAGERVPGVHANRRASAYDVGDLKKEVSRLSEQGCEVGVHGLDAWHSVEKARAELDRVSQVSGRPSTGIRMHWLLQDARTPEILEDAGFSYDSTGGYNETVGYRNGTVQAFRPLGARMLLELPMHIQDGALFYPQRLNLSDEQAAQCCRALIDHAGNHGGVLTLLWHDRSHGPERFWGDFYLTLLEKLKAMNVWFGTAGQVVDWFRVRRAITFQRVETAAGVQAQPLCPGPGIEPPVRIRIHRSKQSSGQGTRATFVDIPWNGTSLEEVVQHLPAPLSATAVVDSVLS